MHYSKKEKGKFAQNIKVTCDEIPLREERRISSGFV